MESKTVERWIDALCEPRELFLAWQPSDATASAERTRWAVGLIRPGEGDFELRYFQPGDEFERFNPGKTYEKLRSLGYTGYPAFGLDKPLHKEGVRAALLRRLPPRKRSDFGEYMRQFRLRREAALSDFALIARTEAKLPSDGFSVIDPLDAEASRCDLLLEVAGYRHYPDTHRHLSVGQEVEITPEPENPYDSQAVKVSVAGQKIGNLNRLQAETFLKWLRTRRVEAVLERLNGSVDRPRAFIFVRVCPCEVQKAA